MRDKRLKVGDIVAVSSMISDKIRYFDVYQVDGNRAFTKFRTFNTLVQPWGAVHEYGNHPTSNSYWLRQ